ncbi:MAG: hypothetical protein H7836_18095, partial [Magnetococcus sp. YQC-3]
SLIQTNQYQEPQLNLQGGVVLEFVSALPSMPVSPSINVPVDPPKADTVESPKADASNSLFKKVV